MLRASLLWVAVVASVLAACSSDEVTPSPAPAPETVPVEEPPPPVPEPTPVPAWKASFPTVVNAGGAVIAAPRIVPILFQGDPMAASIEEFTKKLPDSTFWPAVVSEYGIGALTVAAPIVVQETPPAAITGDEIETWLAAKLAGASPAFGAPDGKNLYAIFYPAGVTVTVEEGVLGQSCEGYGGYHYEITAGATKVGYAVMPRCGTIDELTITTSHEIVEWATDPFPYTAPAYAKLDDAHWAWQAAMIGEIADLCTFLDPDPLKPADIGFSVQRMWSNKLSTAGTFPCAPTKDVPYLQAIPEAEDDALAPDYLAGYVTTKSIRVAPGKKRSVPVHVYSDKPVQGQVPMRALGYDEFYSRPSTSGFSYELSADYADVGDVVQLEITAPTKKSYEILLMLAYTGPQSAHYWPVLVTTEETAAAGARADDLGFDTDRRRSLRASLARGVAARSRR